MKPMRLHLSRRWGIVLRGQLITLCCGAIMLTLWSGALSPEVTATQVHNSLGFGMTIIAGILFANQLCRLLERQRFVYALTSLILLLATSIVLLEISTGWTAVLYSLGALGFGLLDTSDEPSRFGPLYRQLWGSPGPSRSTDQSRPADLGHGLTMLSVTRQKHPEVLDE
jgi:hypothetical protein